jgi:hypothetical protein
MRGLNGVFKEKKGRKSLDRVPLGISARVAEKHILKLIRFYGSENENNESPL